MAVDVNFIPNLVNRGAIDNYIASIAGQYGPEQVNAIAQALSANTAGVSFQELQARLADNVAQQATIGAGGYAAPQISLTDKISALNDLYNLIYQDLGTMTQEQRKKIEEGYGQQAQTAQTGYEQTARQLPLQYGAMGVGDSSYYAKAAGTASDLYNQALKDIQTQKESKLGELGKAYQTQMGSLQAAQSQLGGLPQYGSQADVAALEQQLGSLAQQRAGLGTQASYMGALQNIAPTPTISTGQLETKLKELTGQSIPSFAKQTIGEGQIKQAGLNPEQQSYYTDYFQKLLQGSQSQGA
jgi:hypothetical protein